MEKETKLTGQLSDKEIAALKEKHGEVFEIVVEEFVCYLKKPSRKILSAALQLSQKDHSKFNESVFENCWLGGYSGFKDYDGPLFMAIEPELEILMERKAATVKKL